MKPCIRIVPLLATLALSACTTMHYGNRPAAAVSEHQMAASSAAIQQAERRERAEYRHERRQLLMDQADAIRRATAGGDTVYFIR